MAYQFLQVVVENTLRNQQRSANPKIRLEERREISNKNIHENESNETKLQKCMNTNLSQQQNNEREHVKCDEDGKVYIDRKSADKLIPHATEEEISKCKKTITDSIQKNKNENTERKSKDIVKNKVYQTYAEATRNGLVEK